MQTSTICTADSSEEAIRQQVKEGELRPVEQSEWAAPIVIAKKKNGEIRICADFKTTINPHLRPKTFPLPTAEDVFSTLSQGESFTKLDLARAFKQMEVLEESQPLLTITTHLGLFQYCRLPFGVAQPSEGVPTVAAVWTVNKPGEMSFLSEIGRIPGPQYLPRWHTAHRRKNKRDTCSTSSQ